MTHAPHATSIVLSSSALDAETRSLVRTAGLIAAGSEPAVRESLGECRDAVRAEWVEEIILQSYLFAGFPRTLNAAREWRRISGRPAPVSDADSALGDPRAWAIQGEATCAAVYGPFYDRLRSNIRALHPALDAWMIAEGYGKVLSRPGLDLVRRELCIVAACALSRQDRQLHSHLHGALHVGASESQVEGTLEAIADLLPAADRERYRLLWVRVRGSNAGPAPRTAVGGGRSDDRASGA